MNLVDIEVMNSQTNLTADHGADQKGASRFWSSIEDKTLRDTWASGGLDACKAALEGRSETSIYTRASRIGLIKDFPSKQPERKGSDPFTDAEIKKFYSGESNGGTLASLAQRLGRKESWITRRGITLGVVTPRERNPEWDPKEVEIAIGLAGKGLETIRRTLKRRGFSRTTTAIQVKLKRLNIGITDARLAEGITNAGQLAVLMGVDARTVLRWINLKLLVATRRPGSESDEAVWSIKAKDVRDFIILRPDLVDLRKVDRYWFIDVLTNGVVTRHTCDDAGREAAEG